MNVYVVFQVYRGHRSLLRIFRHLHDAVLFYESYSTFLKESHSSSSVELLEYDVD